MNKFISILLLMSSLSHAQVLSQGEHLALKPVCPGANQTTAQDVLLWEEIRRNEKGTRYDDQGKIYETDEVFCERLPQFQKWSVTLKDIIKKQGSDLLNTVPSDVTYFCPRYKKLNADQKIMFWSQLIVSISKKESGWNPTCRYEEKGLGIDSVTKKPVHSEGLLQLSYQDVKQYKPYFECEFDYQGDKKYPPQDIRRSIQDPIKNLKCGVMIMNHKVKTNQKIMLDKPYWSVLGSINKHSKTFWISQQTKLLSFCN